MCEKDVTTRRKYYDILLFNAVIIMKLFSEQLCCQADSFLHCSLDAAADTYI